MEQSVKKSHSTEQTKDNKIEKKPLPCHAVDWLLNGVVGRRRAMGVEEKRSPSHAVPIVCRIFATTRHVKSCDSILGTIRPESWRLECAGQSMKNYYCGVSPRLKLSNQPNNTLCHAQSKRLASIPGPRIYTIRSRPDLRQLGRCHRRYKWRTLLA